MAFPWSANYGVAIKALQRYCDPHLSVAVRGAKCHASAASRVCRAAPGDKAMIADTPDIAMSG